MEITRFAEYPLNELIVVNKIISFHYHEWHRDFTFPGEIHHYWELVYVDKGIIEVHDYHRQFQLKQGDLWLCKPNTFQAVKSTNNSAPSVINFAFHCETSSQNLLQLFENRIMRITGEEHRLLTELVNEAFAAFDPPINTTSPYVHTLNRRPDAPLGCDQMIKTGIEQLLIRLLRRYSRSAREEPKLSTAAKENRDNQLFRRITEYMQAQFSAKMSMEQLSRHFHIGEASIKKLLHEKTGMGMTPYMIRLKMERAKTMIREDQYNITQIAELLGYGSVHYFSRQFKKEFDMTPTEYAKSVKSHHLDHGGEPRQVE